MMDVINIKKERTITVRRSETLDASLSSLFNQVDVSGGFLVAHYVYDFKEFNGFRFPTRRRAHARNADLQADFSHTLVWIDLSDFQLSCGSSKGPL